ncbi:MAG: serine/threonine-protein kinase [Candidatus Margulisiibacteriota bacterium]
MSAIANISGRAYRWATHVKPETTAKSHAVSSAILKSLYYLIALTAAVVSCRYLSYFRALNLEDLVATGVVSILSGLSAYGVKSTFFRFGKAVLDEIEAQKVEPLQDSLGFMAVQRTKAEKDKTALQEENSGYVQALSTLQARIRVLTADGSSTLAAALIKLEQGKTALFDKEDQLSTVKGQRDKNGSDAGRRMRFDRQVSTLEGEIEVCRKMITNAECDLAEVGTLADIQKVGAGASSIVYRANCVELGMALALKVPKPDVSANFATTGREALLTTSIIHPAVIRVYGLRLHNGMQSMVQEYFNGISLQDYIESSSFSAGLSSENLNLMRQLMEGLAAIHEQGVIHRDLKPGNALTDGKTLKIIDFGLAKLSDSTKAAALPEQNLTTDGSIKGTPTYMAPETLSAGIYECSSDVYTAGLILFEIISRDNPFFLHNVIVLLMEEGKIAIDTPKENLNWDIVLGSFENRTRFSRLKDTFVPTSLPENSVAEQRIKKLVVKMLSNNPSTRPSSQEASIEIGDIIALLQKTELLIEGAQIAHLETMDGVTLPISSGRLDKAEQRGGEKA